MRNHFRNSSFSNLFLLYRLKTCIQTYSLLFSVVFLGLLKVHFLVLSFSIRWTPPWRNNIYSDHNIVSQIISSAGGTANGNNRQEGSCYSCAVPHELNLMGSHLYQHCLVLQMLWSVALAPRDHSVLQVNHFIWFLF